MKKNDIYRISFILLIIDQIIKIIVSNLINLYQEIDIIPGFFSLLYLKNTGAAFSIMQDNIVFLIIISVVFVSFLNYYIRRETHFNNLSIISLGMIIGGIFGNLYDRIVYKAVIDYLAFTIFGYSFPVFNLADIGITVGTVLFLISSYIDKKNKEVKR